MSHAGYRIRCHLQLISTQVCHNLATTCSDVQYHYKLHTTNYLVVSSVASCWDARQQGARHNLTMKFRDVGFEPA
jgi:hypothetical protein